MVHSFTCLQKGQVLIHCGISLCIGTYRDISNLPEQISNPIGRVVLGFIDDANPSTGYNLMLGVLNDV